MKSPAAPVAFFLALTLPAACTERTEPELPADVLAVVEGTPITVSHFEDEMSRRSRGAPTRFATLEARKALLEDLVRLRVLVHRAREQAYDRDPEILAALERMMAAKFQEAALESRGDQAAVSDDEIRRFYEEHQEEYASPERVRAALIFLRRAPRASPEEAATLEEQAEAIRAEALTEASATPTFGSLAKRYSDDKATKYVGGDLGWIGKSERHYRWGDEFVQAVFSLERPGDISPVIAGEAGFLLAKLVERTAAVPRPFESARDEIRHRLLDQKRQSVLDEFHEEMRRGLEIEVRDRLLETLGPPAGVGDAIETPRPPDLSRT